MKQKVFDEMRCLFPKEKLSLAIDKLCNQCTSSSYENSKSEFEEGINQAFDDTKNMTATLTEKQDLHKNWRSSFEVIKIEDTHERFSEIHPIKDNITEDKIKENMQTLKTKLISSKSYYAPNLQRKLDDIEASDLSWGICLEAVYFGEPARHMEVSIKKMCINLVENYNYDSAKVSLFKLTHDMSWKERVDTLHGVTKRILNTLEEVWDNPRNLPVRKARGCM
nr:7781_t:CDS:2 [Entrophospora candida]